MSVSLFVYGVSIGANSHFTANQLRADCRAELRVVVTKPRKIRGFVLQQAIERVAMWV